METSTARLRSFYEKVCDDKHMRTCGHMLAELELSIRHWTCPSCRTRHDRDVNAAKNILAAGLAVTACGAGVRHSGASGCSR